MRRSHEEFDRVAWTEIAEMTNAGPGRQQPGEVTLYAPPPIGLHVIVSDNGGEANLTLLVPLPISIPFLTVAWTAPSITSVAMAHGVSAALRGELIDYELR